MTDRKPTMPTDDTPAPNETRRRVKGLSAILWAMAIVATILAVTFPVWAKLLRGH